MMVKALAEMTKFASMISNADNNMQGSSGGPLQTAGTITDPAQSLAKVLTSALNSTANAEGHHPFMKEIFDALSKH